MLFPHKKTGVSSVRVVATLAFLISVLMITSIARAQSSLVVDNGPFGTASAWNVTSFSIADDFTLTAPVTISTIRFWALDYSNARNLSNFSGTMSWFIHSNTSDNRPGMVVASGFSSGVVVDDTGQSYSGGDAIHIFQMDIPTNDVALDTGTYWLHLKEGTPSETNDTSIIQWLVRDAHSGQALRFDPDPVNATAWASDGGSADLAFQMLSSPISPGVETPEPGSISLLALILLPSTGVITMSIRRRRNKEFNLRNASLLDVERAGYFL